MNLRNFFKSIGAIVVMPWNAIGRQPPTDVPIIERVFPEAPEELPGLLCHNIYGNELFPYVIIREYDEWNDEWMGQKLYNPRRNKWWAKDVSGKTVLVCTGTKFNDTCTMFFKRI